MNNELIERIDAVLESWQGVTVLPDDIYVLQDCKAALTQQQEAEPSSCCRKNPCTHPPGVGPCDKPAAQPQVPEPCKACHGTGKLVLHGKHGAVAHEYDCSLCAAKEEGR